jgi:BASS family bile acid:Na+ symporter
MTGVGLTLRLRDFHNVVYYPRALIFGTLAQIVLMPAAGFALAWALQLPPAIAVGLVIIAACPGGTTSNVFAFLAKGNLALSILMTAAASLITVLTLPLFANWAIRVFTDRNLEQPLQLPVTQTIAMLLAIVFVPVMLGMALRAWKRQLAGRLEGAVGAFGMLVLVALIVLIVVQTRDHLGQLLVQAGPSVIALNVLGILIGLAVARFAGHGFVDGLTLAMELGIKNSTIGLTVTLTLLGSADIAMPSALYGILMFASAAILVVIGRRHAHVRLRPERGEVPSHVPDDVGFPDDHGKGPEPESTTSPKNRNR